MGAALARHYLRQGDQVAVVGRNQAEFDALLAAPGPERGYRRERPACFYGS